MNGAVRIGLLSYARQGVVCVAMIWYIGLPASFRWKCCITYASHVNMFMKLQLGLKST